MSTEADDEVGFDRAPSKYMMESGEEAIDVVRREYGDDAMGPFCLITARLYELRAGRKVGEPAEKELAKAKWYRMFAAFVGGTGPDPREGRKS